MQPNSSGTYRNLRSPPDCLPHEMPAAARKHRRDDGGGTSQPVRRLPVSTEPLLTGSKNIRSVRTLAFTAWAIAGAALLAAAPHALPIRATQLTQERQAVEFTDRNGLPLGTVLTRDQEHTVAVPLDRVSPHFIHAILAAEDGRYYRHGAVELRAVARAVWQLVRHRRVVSGASTIEMQLARMIRPVRPTVIGKLHEMWIAARLEAGMSKPEILSAYLNRLPMGGNVYGVEAAARSYFGVSAFDLDVAQASMLAAIPNDPPRLNPYEHWRAAKQRQAYVLARMVDDRYLSAEDAKRAYAEQMLLAPRSHGILAAPHLLFWLSGQLPPRTAKVRTTIDRPLQDFAEEQVRQVIGRLSARNVHQAALLVVDNRSGEVLAYVGSADYFSEAHQGRNDGVQALRQPGSALKPFLYELALETRAIKPNTILADVPTRYAIPGAMLYSPGDYNGTFQGPVRVRIALADSLNVPAVRVLSKVGVPAFLDRLHQLGFTHLIHAPDYYGLGLTLGAGEVSLWELTRGYVSIARGGRAINLRTVIGDGCSDRACAAVGDPTAWALVTSIIGDAHARAKAFGVGSVLDMPFDAAVKTGTSSDFRDTWTVGFTQDYTVGVWVGNFSGEPMRQISGVTGAAPLWNRLMLHLHERSEPARFLPPAGLVLRPICATTGVRPTPACDSIVYEYLFPEDLADYEKVRSETTASREYDEWRALERPTVSAVTDFRILFPHAGDLFRLKPVDRGSAVPSLPQVVEFQTTLLRGARIVWRLNGLRLTGSTNGNYFWLMRPGMWTLEASTAGKTDRVTFKVDNAGSPAQRRGFSVAGPRVSSRTSQR